MKKGEFEQLLADLKAANTKYYQNDAETLGDIIGVDEIYEERKDILLNLMAICDLVAKRAGLLERAIKREITEDPEMAVALLGLMRELFRLVSYKGDFERWYGHILIDLERIYKHLEQNS